MKSFLFLLAALIPLGSPLLAGPEYPQMGPDIYDPKANGTAEIAKALAAAQTAHKNVLLVFGANWCPWCRSLHRVFEKDANIAKTLRENFVVVLIDSNWRHGEKRNDDVNLRYGNPLHEGLPVLIVLDETGRPLTTQETGALEEGETHSPAKIIAFLTKWAPAKR
mgnify:CR=1 FL=1